MKYSQIAPSCRPQGPVQGCPFDGLGCPYGEQCSIGSHDKEVRDKAWNAGEFGPDFRCVKFEHRQR